MSLEPMDADYVLGETGQTVIYIFPNGGALMDRNQQAAGIKIDTMVSEQITTIEPAPIDPEQWIQQLVCQGKLTEAQSLVIRYDREMTGIDWQDALKMRGWFTVDMDLTN